MTPEAPQSDQVPILHRIQGPQAIPIGINGIAFWGAPERYGTAYDFGGALERHRICLPAHPVYTGLKV